MPHIDLGQSLTIFIGGLPSFILVLLAWMNSNARFSDLNARMSDMDRNLSGRMDRMESHFNSRLDSVDTKIEMLTGSYNEIDKRLGLMEDRQQRP